MSTRIQLDINNLLLAILAAVAVAIAAVTVAAFAMGKRPGTDFRRSDPKSIREIKKADEDLRAFKEFGTLRAITLPDESGARTGAVMLVTPWFSYKETDSAFYEELVARKRLFTSMLAQYFSSHTKNALLSIGEKKIKEQLLEQFNSELKMGQISALYFDDYMFFD